MPATTTEPQQQEVRYSCAHQPPSIEEANRRLYEVEESIAKIQTALQTKTERSSGTPDAYDDWKFRATHALNHRNREREFLIEWIRRKNEKASYAEEMKVSKGKIEHLETLVHDFLSSKPPHKTMYTEANPPQYLEQLHERRDELLLCKADCDAFITLLRSETVRIECPLAFFQTVKQKVAQLIQEIQVELVVLKMLRRTYTAIGGQVSGCRTPLPYKEKRVGAVNSSLHDIKVAIGLSNSGMVGWLLTIVNNNQDKLALLPDQKKKLENIGEYVRLTAERTTIEGKN